jgi:hypothetical protein
VDLFNALLVSTKWKELALSNVSPFPDTLCFHRARLLYSRTIIFTPAKGYLALSLRRFAGRCYE